MAILVTGGAGYIGSHMTYALIDRGEEVVVLDNLSTGSRSLVCKDATFIEGDVGDHALVRRIAEAYRIESVIHFAGSVVVPESVAIPLAYYANNAMASRSLIEASVESGVEHFIFSSTAAVYGATQTGKVAENAIRDPISPYGRSKLVIEWMLQDTSRAYPEFRHMALRYFNVAGADPAGRTGQSTPRATHLIKRACQVALGRVPHLDIFGTDYPTPGGTGVRDFIHVVDLVSAHVLALQALRAGARSACYNCGYGIGISVRQVVSELEKIVGRALPVKECGRRPGDGATVVADPAQIEAGLHWRAEHGELREIIASALEWERTLEA